MSLRRLLGLLVATFITAGQVLVFTIDTPAAGHNRGDDNLGQ